MKALDQPVPYLDAAATTPVDQRVADLVMSLMVDEFGNAGSRTHAFGTRAKGVVEAARRQVADVVGAAPEDVVFTSGATEANNLAIIGLARSWTSPSHVLVSAVEHHAVLEPALSLRAAGHEVELIPVDATGAVSAEQVLGAIREDTRLVSVMEVNNETGVRQPIVEIAEGLPDSVYLHCDAAQGFGKVIEPLRHPRVDLISVSGHKVFAPKGVGALVVRRRGRRRAPLTPLMLGGGQERGFRPGTLPVPLVGGLGLAAELALREAEPRRAACETVRHALLDELQALAPRIHGDPELCVPHILNVSIPGIDGEAAILALRDTVAVSNGSACTSERYEPSHVLSAMGVPPDSALGAIRFSWSHLTSPADVGGVAAALRRVL